MILVYWLHGPHYRVQPPFSAAVEAYYQLSKLKAKRSPLISRCWGSRCWDVGAVDVVREELKVFEYSEQKANHSL
jgi:hypothetical protein